MHMLTLPRLPDPSTSVDIELCSKFLLLQNSQTAAAMPISSRVAPTTLRMMTSESDFEPKSLSLM